MNMIQYVGDSQHYKVFVGITWEVFPWNNQAGSFLTLNSDNQMLRPINPSDFQKWIDLGPVFNRFEVELVNEVFIADEACRDSYAFHLPGYHAIMKLKIGDIISRKGFNNPHLLSVNDKKIICGETTILKHKREANSKLQKILMADADMKPAEFNT